VSHAPGDPAVAQRRVLLCVVGLTPQVVTETAWALCTQEPAFEPSEIHIVTTADGRALIELALLGPHGRLAALARDLGRPALAAALRPERIHVPAVAGEPVADLRGAAEHAAMADLLLALVAGFTEDPRSALHVSMAGGRKTMGFLAGYALSLLGRPQDRLSHVLVPPAFEAHPQFFFPPRVPERLLGPGGVALDTGEAEVVLLDVPFVRLREELPAAWRRGEGGFAAAVGAVQAALEAPRLRIDVAARAAWAGDIRLRLPPVQLAFLLVMARRRGNGDGAASWRELTAQEALAAYGDLFGLAAPGRQRLRAALAAGVDRGWFQERKARHDKLVGEALGRRAAAYRLERVGRRPLSRWRLGLAPMQIEIIEQVKRRPA
jgi:CRISPR-associated protein (TIGR02584 family)